MRTSPTDLTGPGAPITLKLYREGWINVVYPTIQGARGLWPDPLIPVVDSYAGERRNALPWSSTAERPSCFVRGTLCPGHPVAGHVPGWPRAELWHYQSCVSFGCGADTRIPEIHDAFTDWATYVIDHPVPRNRVMGPLAFIGGMKGQLYFDTLQNYNIDYPDPWDSMRGLGQLQPRRWREWGRELFYPGTPSRIGGQSDIPIESLRLKIIRDGLQDYGYLHLLGTVEGTHHYAIDAARQLVQSAYTINPDPAAWVRVRRI